jgi:putative phage-type endonuclease
MEQEIFAVDSPLRLEGIGGSEVGSALGVNPFCSNVELYQIKRGELIDDSQSDAAELGHILEPWILDKYEKKYDVQLERPGDKVYRHKEYPWLFAHVDGIVIGEKRGVDAKSTGLMNWQATKGFGKDGTDEVPKSIICQCVLYMSIFDYDQWDVAALVAGGGVKFYHIYRDLELEEVVLNKLQYFWFENVKKSIPPEPKTVEDVERIYSTGDHGTIESKPAIFKIYLELKKYRTECAEIEKKKKECEFAIKKYMLDHNTMIGISGNLLVTWNKDPDKEVFDKERFKQDEPELYKKYLTTKTGSRRFLIK